MKVTFKHFGAHLASSRYRSIIPAQQLKCAGVGEGTDWLVIGKHGWDWAKQTEGFSKICFDVCDDHFDGAHGKHYREGCERANLVTCNSAEMARVIYAKTGKEAVVIPDPFEQFEGEARINDKLLWFGHQSNLADLVPWLDKLPNLRVVTGLKAPGVIEWSPEAMNTAFDQCGLVVIPTGKSMAKSGNRAVESIRRGLFVVAGYLPAYADLGIYIGDIADGVDWALSHPDLVLRRIKAAQAYVFEEYAPHRIGKMWLKALS